MFYDENEITYYEEQTEEVKKFINNKETIDINDNDIRLGDEIVIYFYPCSQKYIYTLYPKYGKVIENKNTQDVEYTLFNVILKNNNEIYNAFHDGLGIYSRCFDYKVVKLI